MPWTWRTSHDGPSNTWTTTCTTCGESKAAPNHHELVTFRRLHTDAGCQPRRDDETTTEEGATA